MKLLKLFFQKLMLNKADAAAWCLLLVLILACSLIEFKDAIFIVFIQILIATGGFLFVREFSKKKMTLKAALRFSYIFCCLIVFLIFWGAR